MVTIVTSVRLPMKLHEWARKRAKSNGQSISSFLCLTLEQLKHGEEQANRKKKIANLEAITHERNNQSAYK